MHLILSKFVPPTVGTVSHLIFSIFIFSIVSKQLTTGVAAKGKMGRMEERVVTFTDGVVTCFKVFWDCIVAKFQSVFVLPRKPRKLEYTSIQASLFLVYYLNWLIRLCTGSYCFLI